MSIFSFLFGKIDEGPRVAMTLEQAQAVCSPSRSCTLTGAYGSKDEQRTNQRFTRTKHGEQQAEWQFGDPLPEGNRGHQSWWERRPATESEPIAGRDIAEAVHRRNWQPERREEYERVKR